MHSLYAKGWYSKGLALLNSGREEEALESFRNALDAFEDILYEMSQKNAEAWYYKAEIITFIEGGVKALYSYKKAIELQPENIYFWIAKARLLYNLGELTDDYDEAYIKVLELQPENIDDWIAKADFFLLSERISKSIRGLRKGT
ncbi:tetratricopeptide repeat protein [Methanosarcina sp. KYL-1]|uniref:tetratricopeptide repeat protein n=1 Tax=Methanosarcina sp. KYL-1 TaxID=2602068 RepID=UPI0021017D0F|nr:tetratricopeptide repeat protein [Methanosarcina sp. KYL-1]MCQ1536123.1 tetratricopeptide repeat protein [Methanosarcina sp. KYL-1]